jgi:hypothetical protein
MAAGGKVIVGSGLELICVFCVSLALNWEIDGFHVCVADCQSLECFLGEMPMRWLAGVAEWGLL